MKRHLFFIPSLTSLFVLLLLVTSCKKDPPLPEPETPLGTLEIRFKPTMNGVPLEGNSLFIGPNGKRMLLETLKFYWSDIYLHQGNDSILAEDVEFVDLVSGALNFRFDVAPGSYSRMSYAVGLNPTLNGTNNPDYDEAQWPLTHPLSIYNGMYWSWATGYIFSKVEGKTDTSATQNQTPTFTWFYHSGLDSLYSPNVLSDLSLNIEKDQTTILELNLEVNDIFSQPGDTVNMQNDYFTHTTDNLELARKVIRNLSKSIKSN
ncbi:MAG: MbnP family protein [Bacteroidia bacterium]|jgi:hypothetical protein